MPLKSGPLCLIFALSFCGANAQETLGKVVKFDLASKATGQEYALFVSLPNDYAAKDTVKYPVLYVLDGNFMFPVINSFKHLLTETGDVHDMIVVGIGYHTTSSWEVRHIVRRIIRQRRTQLLKTCFCGI